MTGAALGHATRVGPLIMPFAGPDPARGGIGYEGVAVAYKGVTVLEDFTLSIRPGEIMALIGPSGSGKTTALRVTAGFVRPTRGRVQIGGRDVTDLPPYARNIGMVVQNYALFPHMRAEENVAFGLRARKTAETLVRERVTECLRMVGMAAYARRYPRELSGGQQQRVAIARALAIHPDVLLLDEPLSALDAQIRLSMLEELARLHQRLPSLTVMYVTHDQTEALTLAERIG
ncbi:MAG: ABC transporter ATP-binding protein, partial [Acetobacteraceae bacterium]